MKNRIVFYLLMAVILLSCTGTTSQKDIIGEVQTKEIKTEIQEENNKVVFDCDYLGQELPGKKARLFSPNFISSFTIFI